MENIEGNKQVEPGLERDLSGLESIPKLEAIEQDAAIESEQEKVVDLEAVAKKRARGIVRVLEKVFRLKMPGFAYSEEKYVQAEDELGPLIEKYELTNKGPLKYQEEIDGISFLGGTVIESVQAVRAARDEEEKEQEEKEPAQLKVTTLGNTGGEKSKPFTTQ